MSVFLHQLQRRFSRSPLLRVLDCICGYLRPSWPHSDKGTLLIQSSIIRRTQPLKRTWTPYRLKLLRHYHRQTSSWFTLRVREHLAVKSRHWSLMTMVSQQQLFSKIPKACFSLGTFLSQWAQPTVYQFLCLLSISSSPSLCLWSLGNGIRVLFFA